MNEDRNEERENLNQNLMDEMEGESREINNQNEIINDVSNSEVVNYPEVGNNEADNSNNSDVNFNIYNQQQPLSDKIKNVLGPNDIIKIEYEKAIFSDFEKILEYDPFTNTFEQGLDYKKPYPYHFNPALITIKRYRGKSCDCCSSLHDIICKNEICEKILFFFNLFMDLKNIFSILSALDSVVFLSSFVTFVKDPSIKNLILMLFVYLMTLFFESKLLYYKLPPPIRPDEFKKKIQDKIQTAQRIYFGDDKKVIPLVYHCYKDISGPLELTKSFNLINFSGRPGTYFLDGKTIREFNKLNESFRLRGGNCKYYIIYEDSPKSLNTEMNYETQSLNGLFNANELKELIMQEDELIYLAPQGFEKWNKIATICFFCLVGEIYNNYFIKNLSIKSYKVRKALFFEEPEQEIEEKLQKYLPKVVYQGNVVELDNYSDKLNQNIIKPYFDKWEENYDNENNVKEYI
jgi:hypothetical protein